ncbi:MAG: hypothetical protein P1V18_02695 [Candidatus Gracilibacteria bacterium]|nr:hypothetical protein [Candidatus Gracilibacteria bacterium]
MTPKYSSESQDTPELYEHTLSFDVENGTLKTDLRLHTDPNGNVIEILDDIDSPNPKNIQTLFRSKSEGQFRLLLKTLNNTDIEVEQPDYTSPREEEYNGRIYIPKKTINEALRLGSLKLTKKGASVIISEIKPYLETKIQRAKKPKDWTDLECNDGRDDEYKMTARVYWVDNAYWAQLTNPKGYSQREMISEKSEDTDTAQKVFQSLGSAMRFGQPPSIHEITQTTLRYMKSQEQQALNIAEEIERRRKSFLGKIKRILRIGE